MEANNFNVGLTRFTHAYDGVHHFYGTDRKAVIVQSFGGVFSRCRNAYYHDVLGRWFLLDNTAPAWRETEALNGDVSLYHAVATNDEDTEPTWTLIKTRSQLLEVVYTDLRLKEEAYLEKQLISELTGLAPFVVASNILVTNLNADRVDSLHAAITPESNKLLALDQNSKWPNSTLYMGTGNGLDADLLDGHHWDEIPSLITTATAWVYDSGWVNASTDTNVTFTHNLNTHFKEIVIHFRSTVGSGDPTSHFSPNTFIQWVDGFSQEQMGFIKMWYTSANAFVLRAVGATGITATGTVSTGGQWRVYAR